MSKIFLEACMDERAVKNHGTKQLIWQNHIEAWQRSGQSQQDYCQIHGLALATFGYWRRKLKEVRPEKPRFYPLVVTGQPSFPNGTGHNERAGVRVVLGGSRFTIEIDESFSPVTLRAVITTLEQL
jgi:hypothetical protein